MNKRILSLILALSMVAGLAPAAVMSAPAMAAQGSAVTGVRIIYPSVSMKVGTTMQLMAAVTPADAADKNITWSVSNPAVATITQGGALSALATGSVRVTAKADNGVSSLCLVMIMAGGVQAMTVASSDDSGLAPGAGGTLRMSLLTYGINNNAVIAVTFDQPGPTSGPVTVSANTAVLTANIPAGYAPGVHTVSFSYAGVMGAVTASGTFTVPENTGATPTIAVASVDDGKLIPGDNGSITVNLTTTGIADGAVITAAFDEAGPTAGPVTVMNNAATLAAAIPPGYTPGPHTVTFTYGAASATAPYTVPRPPVVPAITVVSVDDSGLAPDDNGNITVSLATTNIADGSIITAAFDEDGPTAGPVTVLNNAAALTAAIPPGYTPGPHTVTFTYGAASAAAQFTVPDRTVPVVTDEYATLNFDMGWKFTKAEPEGPSDHTYLFAGQHPEAVGFDDSAWQDVSLPHSVDEIDAYSKYQRGQPTVDPVIYDTDGAAVKQTTHDGQRVMYTGKMWYRKDFTIGQEYAGKKIFIQFEGARQAADVYLNGVQLQGKCENGFIPFGYDLTPYINFGGNNVIAVMVDNTYPYRTTQYGPFTSANKNDFILSWDDSHWAPNYGGLYRNAYIYVKDPLHITLPLYSFLQTQGTYVYTKNITNTSAGVSMEAEIQNEYGTDKTFTYKAEVLDMDGNVVLSAQTDLTLPAGKKTSDAGVSAPCISDGRAVLSGTLDNPRRWSPDYPYMYTVRTSIIADGKTLDSTDTPLGVRDWKFSYDYGFEINGYNIKLQGWAQRPGNEWPGLADALPNWLQDYTLKQMKDDGANFIRWAHSAGSPVDIQLSDKYGLIAIQPGVDGEGLLSTGFGYSDIGYKVRINAFRDMLIYYRNSPSILLWEYGNQQVTDTNDYQTGQKDVNIQLMSQLIDKWDPSGGRERTARDASSNMLPYMTVVESTDGNTTGRSAGYPIVESELDRSEAPRRVWDKSTPGYTNYTTISTPDYQNWTSADYAKYSVTKWNAMTPAWHSGGAELIYSDSTSHGRVYSDVDRLSGAVDGVRLQKETYYTLGAMWSAAPSLYIIGHWNYPAGTVKDIDVVSSAGVAKVELFVNGVSAGSSSSPANKFDFTIKSVAWQAGTLTAVGYDKNGVEVCRASKETTGPPAALKVTPIIPPGGLKAGGDTLLVDVEAVDSQGRRCQTFEGQVVFDTSQFDQAGTATFKGGYNSNFENTVQNCITNKTLYLEAGINRVAIQTTAKAGDITLGAALINQGPAQQTGPRSGVAQPTTPLAVPLSGSCTVSSAPVDNTGGLCADFPSVYKYDISGLKYPGVGNFDGGVVGPGDVTDLTMISALMKDLSYTGAAGASGNPYAASVRNPAAKGEPAYNDNAKPVPGDTDGSLAAARKSLTFGELPAYLVNSDYIYAPNDDANSQAEDIVTFSAGRDITVFVAFDDRLADQVPDWLTTNALLQSGNGQLIGFKPTGDKIMIGKYPYTVYGITLLKGDSMHLGSNKDDVSEAGNMYVVFAKETRILYNFLYDDFMMQNAGETPEGWFISTPANTDIKIAADTDNSGNPIKAMRLTDTNPSAYAIAGRRISTLESGKYVVKFNVKENNLGTRQQFERLVLEDGQPAADATDNSNVIIETYIHSGNYVYRLKQGDSSAASQKIAGAVPVGQWFQIELDVDMDARTYDIKIDGATKATGLPFTSDSTNPANTLRINWIAIGTRQNTTNSDMEYSLISMDPVLPPGGSLTRLALTDDTAANIALSPAFSPDITDYTGGVLSSAKSLTPDYGTLPGETAAVSATVNGSPLSVTGNTIALPALSPGDAINISIAVNGARTYHITLNVTDANASATDNTLSRLLIGGVDAEGFSPGMNYYLVYLPYGTTAVPPLSAAVSSSRASAVVNNAAAPDGVSTVTVTAGDGTVKTYAVAFSVLSNADHSLDIKAKDFTGCLFPLDGKYVTGAAGSYVQYTVLPIDLAARTVTALLGTTAAALTAEIEPIDPASGSGQTYAVLRGGAPLAPGGVIATGDTLTVANGGGSQNYAITVKTIIQGQQNTVGVDSPPLQYVGAASNRAIFNNTDTTAGGAILGYQRMAQIDTSNGGTPTAGAASVGDYLEYTVKNIPAGTYNMSIAVKNSNNRGIFQVTVDGAPVATVDMYYNSGGYYTTMNVGAFTLDGSAQHVIRFTVTGINPAATTKNYQIALGLMTLTAVPV